MPAEPKTSKSKQSAKDITGNVVLADAKQGVGKQVETALAPVFGLQRPLIQHDVKKVNMFRQ